MSKITFGLLLLVFFDDSSCCYELLRNEASTQLCLKALSALWALFVVSVTPITTSLFSAAGFTNQVSIGALEDMHIFWYFQANGTLNVYLFK